MSKKTGSNQNGKSEGLPTDSSNQKPIAELTNTAFVINPSDGTFTIKPPSVRINHPSNDSSITGGVSYQIDDRGTESFTQGVSYTSEDNNTFGVAHSETSNSNTGRQTESHTVSLSSQLISVDIGEKRKKVSRLEP